MAQTETLTRTKTKKPSQYQVVLLNDDYTPMDFVIEVLATIFNKSEIEATAIMLAVHQQGKGVCGIYSFEVAETKMLQVLEMSTQHQYPLQCQVEEV